MLEHIDAVRPNSPPGSQRNGDAQNEAAPEQEQEDEMGEEAVIPRAVPDVTQPTQQERAEHDLTHAIP